MSWADSSSRAGHEVEVVTPFPGDTLVDGIRVHRLGEPLLPLDVPFTPATFRKTERSCATATTTWPTSTVASSRPSPSVAPS